MAARLFFLHDSTIGERIVKYYKILKKKRKGPCDICNDKPPKPRDIPCGHVASMCVWCGIGIAVSDSQDGPFFNDSAEESE